MNLKRIKDKIDHAQYFQSACSWADDIYTHTLASRNRYQLAFLVSMGFAALLSLVLCIVVINQRVNLVVVHRNESGFTYVTLEQEGKVQSMSRAEIEADIVRYVVARESYHPGTYQEQSSLVSLLSYGTVSNEYELSQDQAHLTAPVHVLKNTGYRKVSVKSILFLDQVNESSQEAHKNIAQVNFVISDYLLGRDQHIDMPYTVLVSWEYRGAPSDPEKRWKNWSGFVVTVYQLSQVNVDKS